jgi:hypothetical protein
MDITEIRKLAEQSPRGNPLVEQRCRAALSELAVTQAELLVLQAKAIGNAPARWEEAYRNLYRAFELLRDNGGELFPAIEAWCLGIRYKARRVATFHLVSEAADILHVLPNISDMMHASPAEYERARTHVHELLRFCDELIDVRTVPCSFPAAD